MSLAVATQIGLTYYQPYEGPPVRTAMAGSTMDIVRVIKSASFTLTDESSKRHVFFSRLVIVRHLSCGLKVSLPFLVENGLDQLHSQGILLWTKKQFQFRCTGTWRMLTSFFPNLRRQCQSTVELHLEV